MTREHAPRPGATVPLARLTPSQRTVLVLLANGRTVTELCAELHLARHTINTHRSAVYRKLGVHSLAEAVEAALGAGVLAPGDIVSGPVAERRRLAALEREVAVLRQRIGRGEEQR